MMLDYDVARAIQAQRIREAEVYRLAKQASPAKRRPALRRVQKSLRLLFASLATQPPAHPVQGGVRT